MSSQEVALADRHRAKLLDLTRVKTSTLALMAQRDMTAHQSQADSTLLVLRAERVAEVGSEKAVWVVVDGNQTRHPLEAMVVALRMAARLQ